MLQNDIGKYFDLKEDSIVLTLKYLEENLRELELENGQKCWAFGSNQYVESAVNNVVDYLNNQGKGLTAKALNLMTNGYRHEIDISYVLGPEDEAYYQSLIGVSRWIFEHGRVDINVEASGLSLQLAIPREGHLEELLSLFAYIKKYMNSEIVFHQSIPDIDMNSFQRKDWSYSIYYSLGNTL